MIYNGLERGSHEIYYVEDTLENIKQMTKEEIIETSTTSAIFSTTTTIIVKFKESTMNCRHNSRNGTHFQVHNHTPCASHLL